MPKTPLSISLSNIGDHKPAFEIDPTAIPEGAMWRVFDETKFSEAALKGIVPLSSIISEKDESKDPKFLNRKKPDPRETAYHFMVANAAGGSCPRSPITVTPRQDGTFLVVDGNATAQVIMMAGWEMIPCIFLE